MSLHVNTNQSAWKNQFLNNAKKMADDYLQPKKSLYETLFFPSTTAQVARMNPGYRLSRNTWYYSSPINIGNSYSLFNSQPTVNITTESTKKETKEKEEYSTTAKVAAGICLLAFAATFGHALRVRQDKQDTQDCLRKVKTQIENENSTKVRDFPERTILESTETIVDSLNLIVKIETQRINQYTKAIFIGLLGAGAAFGGVIFTAHVLVPVGITLMVASLAVSLFIYTLNAGENTIKNEYTNIQEVISGITDSSIGGAIPMAEAHVIEELVFPSAPPLSDQT